MKKTRINFLSFLVIAVSICLLLFTGCKRSQPSLKVAASSIPHAEILEFVKPMLAEEGVNLEIIVIDDYHMPNRALVDKEVDANFFQHLPFLEAQIKDFGYDLIPLAGVHLEPLGLYSKKISSINQLKKGNAIGIPSDPSNQSRALGLLQQENLIFLNGSTEEASLLSIKKNPLQLKFIEMDSALLSRALEDVEAAIINTNFALLAGLSPQADALALESGASRFVNILVVRKEDDQRPDLLVLKNALMSNKTKEFILEHYQGALLPAF